MCKIKVQVVERSRILGVMIVDKDSVINRTKLLSCQNEGYRAGLAPSPQMSLK